MPEHRLKVVRESAAAGFELWSDPGHRHAARLRELSPSADPTSRTYPARFSIVEPPEFIGLGMTATLSFERPDATPRGRGAAGRDLPAGHAARRLGGRQGDRRRRAPRPSSIARWRNDTAAIASGVKDGELIATAGVHKLEAGQKVKPVLQAARPRS